MKDLTKLCLICKHLVWAGSKENQKESNKLLSLFYEAPKIETACDKTKKETRTRGVLLISKRNNVSVR